VELCAGSLATIQQQAGSLFNLSVSLLSTSPTEKSPGPTARRRRKQRPQYASNATRPLLMKTSSLPVPAPPPLILLMPMPGGGAAAGTLKAPPVAIAAAGSGGTHREPEEENAWQLNSYQRAKMRDAQKYKV
jgi:hypothetical protein